ncbi:glycosyltransferase [Rhizobium paknamense]
MPFRLVQAGFSPSFSGGGSWIWNVLELVFISLTAIATVRPLIVSALAVYCQHSGRLFFPAVTGRTDPADFTASLAVSVLVPAYNEAKVIEATVRRLLESRGVAFEILVIDDGSQDETADIVRRAFAHEPRVRLIEQANGGKASALNHGLHLSSGEIVIALDADTHFEAETVLSLVKWFIDPGIGAVAGNTKVGNCHNAITRWQDIEYVTVQNHERVAFSSFGAMMVVPGAAGAWRRSALLQVGGFPLDTLAEDQDATIALQAHGWKVIYDAEAVAWTEAPDRFRDLMKQRLRWSYGTVQCLLKHRNLCFSSKVPGIGWIGLPQVWFFQIGFAIVAPLIDLMMIVTGGATMFWLIRREMLLPWMQPDKMLFCFSSMLLIELICGSIACRLEQRPHRFNSFSFLTQRFAYRQSMYLVVLKSLHAHVLARQVGWGKLPRSGLCISPEQHPVSTIIKEEQ